MCTVCQSRLCACTLHVIQPYWTRASTEVSTSWTRNCVTAAKLSTHHIGTGQFPFIITHCSPLAFIENLYSTWAFTRAIDQTNHCCIWKEKWRDKKIMETHFTYNSDWIFRFENLFLCECIHTHKETQCKCILHSVPLQPPLGSSSKFNLGTCVSGNNIFPFFEKSK